MIREMGIEIRPGDVLDFTRGIANRRDANAAEADGCEPGPVRAEYEDHARGAEVLLARVAQARPGEPLELIAEDQAERMALAMVTDQMLRGATEAVARCDVDDYGAIDAALDTARYWNDQARELNLRFDLAEAADYGREAN